VAGFFLSPSPNVLAEKNCGKFHLINTAADEPRHRVLKAFYENDKKPFPSSANPDKLGNFHRLFDFSNRHERLFP
jgi:hypothetical protein